MSDQALVDRLLEDQNRRWRGGDFLLVEEYLRRHPELQANDEGVVDLICNEKRWREEQGPSPRMDLRQDYLARFPQYDDQLLRQFELEEDILPMLADDTSGSPEPFSSNGGHGAPSTPEPVGEDGTSAAAVPGYPCFGDYRCTKILGEGGMGIVYLARQASLNREVALKMIRTGPWPAPDAVKRFCLEAIVLASLDQPHVVPIYEVGECADELYYTMKVMRGGSLVELIPRLTQDHRVAARLLEKVSRAVHETHRRGILHLDLKPGNILLDEHGEPHVSDFGLAEQVEGQVCGEESERVGTPHYMAPEQVRGKRSDFTWATDVYGLGAILYELLTGRMPFKVEDGPNTTRCIAERVVGSDPAPPRTLKRGVAPDLEAVCLKCLQKEPEKRYANALELAEDLARWLKGHVTLARPRPVWVRAGKWVRRKPVSAALGGASVLLLVLAMVSLALGLRASAQREKAGRLLLMVRSAGAKFTEIGDVLLRNVPRTESIRQAVLEEASSQYEQLIQIETTDPRLRLELGRAYGRLGMINHHLGRLERAEEAYQRARSTFAGLAAESPAVAEYRAELAASLQNLATLVRDAGRPATEAEAAYRQAMELLDRLVEEDPNEGAYQRGLAVCYGNLGLLSSRMGQRDRAVAAYEKVVTLVKGLDVPIKTARGNNALDLLLGSAQSWPQDQKTLAMALNNLASHYSAAGRLAEVRVLQERALEMREVLVRQYPEVPEYRQDLAQSYHNLGVWNRDYSRTPGSRARAEKLFGQAIDMCQGLARDYPKVPEYRQALARGHINQSAVFAGTGRTSRAEQSCQQALSVLEPLVSESPDVYLAQRELAATYGLCASYAKERNPLADVKLMVQKAVTAWERVVRGFPGHPDDRNELAASYGDLGELYRVSSRKKEFEEAWRKAREIWEQLTREHPTNSVYATNLGRLYFNLGNWAMERQDYGPALELNTLAISVLEAVSRQNPRADGPSRFLCQAHWNRAIALDKKGDHAQALNEWDVAIKLASGRECDLLRLNRAVTLARSGKHKKAIDEATAVLGHAPKAGNQLGELARVYALAAKAAGEDTGLPLAERGRLADRYAGRAVELLSRARGTGLYEDAKRVDWLKNDEAYGPLRSRPDFQKLLQGIDGQGGRGR